MSDDKTEKGEALVPAAAPETAETATKKLFLEHEIDADEAMKAIISHEGESFQLDAETERRLLRKIDLHLMPV